MGCAAQEVGLAGMLSILTAVLLDTTGLSHVSAAEPDFTALPTNFSSVAKAVLRYCVTLFVVQAHTLLWSSE